MGSRDRKSTRLNSSHTEIYTLSLHDALPISPDVENRERPRRDEVELTVRGIATAVAPSGGPHGLTRSEEHTSELQSHRDLHSFPTRRSSDLSRCREP